MNTCAYVHSTITQPPSTPPLGKPPVISVSPHVPTLIAYQKMLDAGVSGAAVTADTGELIANLSLSELRAIQPEHFGALALPVGEFLALLHGTVYVGYSAFTSSAAKHPFFASAAGSSGNESDVRILTALPNTTFRQVCWFGVGVACKHDVVGLLLWMRVHHHHHLRADGGDAGQQPCASHLCICKWF